MFKSPNKAIGKELSALDEKFPKWYHSQDESGKNWADPHLISYAKVYNSTLVTQEKWHHNSEEQNYDIPTVCEKLGAYCHIGKDFTKNIDSNTPFQCIDFFELIKRESLFEEE
jgi:hypothetical protein